MAKRTLSQLGLNVQAAPLAWARIERVAGASSDTIYTDANGVRWRCIQWTADASGGLVVAAPGLADVFLIAGADAGWTTPQGTTIGSGGGRIADGLRRLGAGIHSIQVGAGGTGNSGRGTVSKITGPSTSIVAYLGGFADGAGATESNSPWTSGTVSTITGTAIEFGIAGTSPRANRGDGSLPGQNNPGGTGFVAIRVPV